MVTDWEGYWRNRSTFYTIPVIKNGLDKGPWPDEASTLFIKLNKDGSFEKSWTGISKKFLPGTYKGKPAINFVVAELKETDCPEEFKQLSNGWYLNTQAGTDNILSSLNQQPAFFAKMATCSWEEFEQCCFLLLRLLGIHEIHKFPQSNNRGKADGFFKFRTLAVLYDTTLEPEFEMKKDFQFDNFVNQLNVDKFKDGSWLYSINGIDKQVWIITRRDSVRLIRTEDNIKVKEIPYTALIEVYHRRLDTEIGFDELCTIIKDLN
jgi:hypothetical protein